MPERVFWGGRYAIYDELASGGMATVYLAARLSPDEEIPPVVALKKLSAPFAKQPEFVAMFLDEAHLAARIRHPNVVPTYEFLRTDEGLGIVMGLVIGRSLMQLGRAVKPGASPSPPLAISLAIMVGALDGLQAAHQVSDDAGKLLNLVHRDVSPHNILVGLDGVARVIDFGIAKAAGRLQVTDVGVLKGKFAYMSPEQIAGKAVDRRADVYSTGIVLWELLAGRKLFRSANDEFLTQRSDGQVEVPPPSSLNPAVPGALDAIVLRALSHDPSARFGSALAMAETIRADLPVAEAGAVSEWVRSIAGEQLTRLDARRQAILELTKDDPDPPRISQISLPVGVRSSAPPKRPSASGAPRPPPPPVSVPLPPSVPSPHRFSGDLDLSARGAPETGARVDMPLELEDVGPSSGARSFAPALEGVRRERPHFRRRAERSHRGPLLLGFIVVLLATCAVVAFEGPPLLKARVVATARAHGVSIAVDRVELAHGGLHITGLLASLASVPAARMTASEVDVALDQTGSVESITLPSYELTITGTLTDLSHEFAVWREGQHTALAVTANAGHVVWTAPTLPGVTVEAHDTSLEIAASPDAAFVMTSAGLFIQTPRGSIGPWRAHLESSRPETRVRLGLDPSIADAPPTATAIYRQVEGTTWALDIPRGSTFKIGIPPEIFGTTTDLGLEAAVNVQLSPGGDMLKGEAQVGLYGWPLSASRSTRVPVDMVVSGEVTGDPAQPLRLSGGKLTLGTTTSPVPGVVVVAKDGVRIEIDYPSAHAGGVPALVFDTREWTAPKAGSLPRPPRPSASH